MTTENLSPSSLGSVTYPGAVLAAFSPCPFIVRMTSAATVTMTIANGTTGRSVSERRTLRLTGTATYEATFEVSRLLQSLGDVDTLLQRIEYDSSVDTFGQLADELTITMASGSSTIFSCRLFMLYATADAMERRGRADTPRRLRAYRDLPFTAQMGYNDDNASVGFVFGRSFIAACDGRDDFPLGYEVPLWGLAAAVDATKDGNTLAIDTTPAFNISDGSSDADLYPVNSRRLQLRIYGGTQGVYLRWLKRDGSCGYWRFILSKTAVSAAAGNSFVRHLSGLPAAPESGTYRNPAASDLTLGETWTIGCPDVDLEDWRELTDLACSPVVERMVGGTQAAPLWQRVNVVPGSYARTHKRSTLDQLADFEMQITLPERNTIRL